MQKDVGEKPAIMMVEDIGNDDDLKKPQVKKDYSGVAAKTDPAEIALVKKLDRWIMPMLWVRKMKVQVQRVCLACVLDNDGTASGRHPVGVELDLRANLLHEYRNFCSTGLC